MGTIRKLLIATVVIGSLAGVTGSGTFASFNATTTNAASAFDTGTIALGQGTGASTCWSTGVTATTPDTSFSNGNLAACNALFTTQANVKPGMADIVSDLTLTNATGGLNASALKVYMSTPCTTQDDGGTVHGPTTAAGGTSDLCNYLRFTIVEYQAGFGSQIAVNPCKYGNNSCVTANNTLTLYNFQASGGGSNSNYSSIQNSLDLGAMNAGASRYFRITISFPNGSSGNENGIMGKKVGTPLFVLGWTLES
jgi:hypothetical protein